MLYVIKETQSIIDVATQLYGSPNYAVKLVSENTNLESITNTDIAGITVTYDEIIKTNIDKNLNGLNVILKPIDNTYVIKSGQSVYDVASQFGYGIDRIVEFIILSGLNSFSIGNSTIINVPIIKDKIANNLILTNRILATLDGSISRWILATGFWNDEGIWIDEDFWID